ncbi:MAG TPA: hemerythrin domain-containing protein [Longimicrobiales bacterium]|nr:hemerythrin domain-containing protein [Longimicrobiales bacterium]
MKVTDAFLGEHAVFYAQFDACEQTLTDADLGCIRLQASLIASALKTHAQLEDTLLFDGLQTRPDTPTLFAVMEQEHSEIERMLVQLQDTRDLEAARDLVRDVIHAARDHFLKEERSAFPMAEQLLGDAALTRLGEQWAEARRVSLGEALPAL